MATRAPNLALVQQLLVAQAVQVLLRHHGEVSGGIGVGSSSGALRNDRRRAGCSVIGDT